MPQTRAFSASRVVFDDRYSPLLISTFSGKADVETAKWHLEVQNAATLAAAAAGQRIISISDSTRSTRPDADARKFWAANMSQTPDAVRQATLATFVVLDSALLRGALTAIGWMNSEALALETFPSLSAAIVEGQRRLEIDGQRIATLDPDAYRLPAAE